MMAREHRRKSDQAITGLRSKLVDQTSIPLPPSLTSLGRLPLVSRIQNISAVALCAPRVSGTPEYRPAFFDERRHSLEMILSARSESDALGLAVKLLIP